MNEQQYDNDPVIIPIERLVPDTLHALVEEFVTRDGTDYGLQERSTASKVEAVISLLVSRKAFIIFDEDSGRTDIVEAEKLRSLVELQLDDDI